MKKYFLVVFAVLSLVACKTSTKNEVEHIRERTEIEHQNVIFPEPAGFVNDFDKIFTPAQKEKLEKFIAEYEQQTSSHIAVVTVNSIAPYKEIQWYATDLANYWGVGKEENNNGLLILLNKTEREIWISTGLGTEKVLTDEIVKHTIDSVIIPEFKSGHYYDGILKGLKDLTSKWNQGL